MSATRSTKHRASTLMPRYGSGRLGARRRGGAAAPLARPRSDVEEEGMGAGVVEGEGRCGGAWVLREEGKGL